MHARVVQLESLMTHLQQSLDDLNVALVDQSQQQQETTNRIRSLEKRLDQQAGDPSVDNWSSDVERDSQDD
jgi:uncharacterized coiled-coil protein SlyX